MNPPSGLLTVIVFHLSPGDKLFKQNQLKSRRYTLNDRFRQINFFCTGKKIYGGQFAQPAWQAIGPIGLIRPIQNWSYRTYKTYTE